MKEPRYRIENGKKLYRMEVRIDAQRRPAPNLPTPDIKRNKVIATNGPPGEQPTVTAATASEDPDIVRERFRLISAVDAYPTKGWMGPQHVDYGHLNGQAIRETVDLINNAMRPVPLMWNHTDDITMKAGHIEDAAWENSKDIPPGVNADLVVNRRYDPKAAIGLETGVLNATSIAVGMEHEISHPNLTFQEFVTAAAEGREIDGKPVMWLPVHAYNVYHHALVWSGADPNSGPRVTATENNNGRNDMAQENNDSQSGAVAAQNQNRGEVIMEENAMKILASLCRELGFDVILSEGAPMPEGLQARLSNRAKALIDGTGRYNELAAKVIEVGEKVQIQNRTAASTLDILAAIAGRLPLADYGEKYVADLREQALKAFDGAKVDPTKPEPTLEHKTMRDVIAGATSVEQLKAYITEYEGQKAGRFGPVNDMRTTKGDNLPPVVTPAELSAEQRRIQASMKQWKGDK